MGTKRIRKNKARPRNRKNDGGKRRGVLAGLKVLAALTGLICLSMSFILAYDLVTQCGLFKSKHVHILGAERLSEDQVLRQAGISPPVNILAVNLTLVRKRLLRHPWIAEARVARELPDILSIRIREQEPLAVLDLGGKFVINTGGEVFKAWEASDPEELPLVTGLSFSDIPLAKDSASPAFNALMTALDLGRERRAVLPNREIRRIHVDPDLGLTLYAFGGNQVVKLGTRNLREKYRCLETLLVQLDRQPGWVGFATIDLINPNRVIVNPVRQGTYMGEFKEGFGAGT